MSDGPKLRGHSPRRSAPYPLGEIPRSAVIEIGRRIFHRIAIGDIDLSGDQFGEIFAHSIGGTHKGSPLGIADVEYESCAWSVKSVKSAFPARHKIVRTISGRNSPNYSTGRENPLEDIQATGRDVLNIWNARVDESLHRYSELRIAVFLRNMTNLTFTLFEHEATRYIPSEYSWELNKSRNLIGMDRNGVHRFTWQPHGSQFTVLREVPSSAVKFRLTERPSPLTVNEVVEAKGFNESWVESI